ncbi:DUF4190 domain-containing protein [Streptomyces sp. AM 2-1-1]|uniref:DUF4190 domain-containing protein n=1 Tax=unclassified Streptomyces TaxID=2593676 RepID=UPI0023BA28EC|nr:DUF4190 domain-containing protein [Streptomyces sp. AM 2-1-1]WEH39408.1 DUF4190 domain-containing protein [Streptomyces sp. AM 2-1-1]
MSENTELPGGGQEPRDPWAAPDGRVELGKQGGEVRPPAVHDQPTVTSMPGFEGPQQGPGPFAGGYGPPPAQGGFGPGPAEMPPPPYSPNGPGQQPVGQYGYPAVPPQQQYPGYTGYDAYGGQGLWAPVPANGMGITAMVLGILSICLFCMYGVASIILGVLALIFGILGRKRAQRGEATNGGQALAGIITGSVGILIGAVIIGFLIWAFAVHADDFEDDDSYYDDPFATSLVIDRS